MGRTRINPPVFLGSAGLILAFVIFGAAAPEAAAALFKAVQGWITDTFGWFYLLSVAVFVVFAFGLALSQHGRIRLGTDDSRPDYSYGAWFAMLFSAGMGIGLMYFGVAEPVMHYASPPTGTGGTVGAAHDAMVITFFHWGLHAWAIYAVLGLALAYFSYRRGLPLTIRSALYPLIGDRIYGPIGHAADIFAILGTMFGVATSLGLGVMQVNAGLDYLFGVPQDIVIQILLIAGITALATASVVAGLDAGIKRLSLINLWLALALLAFVLLAGPTLFLFKALIQNLGSYLSEVVTKTFTLYAYQPNSWIGGWTLFYWAWWIAWAPFVGMFIARISRGRTIREFLLGVLLVPVGFTFLWMTVFGNTAISLDMGVADGAIATAVSENVPTALFKFLEHFPFSSVVSLLAVVLVVTFFVTSSDSGSFVIDIIASGGDPDPPVWQRVFWATTEGVVAAVLLLAGGLGALQTASIAAALPFAFVMLFVCYGLLQGLRQETHRSSSKALPVSFQIQDGEVPWERRLKTILRHPGSAEVDAFIAETVAPALYEVIGEIRNAGLDAEIDSGAGRASLTIRHAPEQQFRYAVISHAFQAPVPVFAATGQPGQAGQAGQGYSRAEVHLEDGGQQYDVMGYTREQIIADLLSQYEKHIQFLHLSR